MQIDAAPVSRTMGASCHENRKHHQRPSRRHQGVAAGVVLAALVAFCCTVALVLPSVTLASTTTGNTDAGVESSQSDSSVISATNILTASANDSNADSSDQQGASDGAVSSQASAVVDPTSGQPETSDASSASNSSAESDDLTISQSDEASATSSDNTTDASATQISGSDALTNANIANGGSFQLSGDVTQGTTIWVASGKTVTLDLNGCAINYTGDTSLFHVQDGGTLTIIDSKGATDTKAVASGNAYGNEASVTYSNGVPKLTYYVTESTPTPNSDQTRTTETLHEHTVNPGGVITATNSSGANSVIYMDGGTLNVQGGMICMPNSASHSSDCHIINVEGGIFNLSGGYIVGGQRTSNWGGGVHLKKLKNSGPTLNMTGGVIAANKAKAGAGVYAENGTTVNVSDGVISGNEVVYGNYGPSEPASDGYGGGIYAVGATVSVSGGYITNNVNNAKCNLPGQGLIGGGGIAIMNDSSQASLSISGGYIAGNYVESAGGGIYAGRQNKGLTEHFSLTGGTVASNVANTGEGGGIRVSANTTATFDVASGSHAYAYITNNICNSEYDWGGGGVFVQEGGFLAVKNTLITGNSAGGYGGGVAACPSGETVITHMQGSAIYGNSDAGSSPSANMSSGGHGKNMDSTVAYDKLTFRNNGHADYFLVRASDKNTYISVVTGRMLGGGAANWSGSVDGVAADTIDSNSGVSAKYMVGLTAYPDDAAKSAAIAAATLIISGNHSHNHGGGIMTNGGLVLGNVGNVNIYPGLSIKAKKSLVQDGVDAASQLTEVAYNFVLLSPNDDSQKPSWNDDGTLNYGGCTEASRTTSEADGTIRFDVSDEYSSSGRYRYYVAELPNSAGVDTKTQTYDKTIYQIDSDVEQSSSTQLLNITFNHYSINSLTVTAISKDGTRSTYTPSTTTNPDNSVSFTLGKSLDKDGSTTPAFTNTLAPYQTTGSFTAQVQKHVAGGEVKKFQFELYDEKGFDGGKWDRDALQTQTIKKSGGSDATVDFDPISYKLGVKDLDTKARGGKATYTYYIREKSGSDNGYTYDGGYYKVVVTAQDNSDGTMTVTPVYTYVDASGNESSTSTKVPTFNNKYATSLPNAGQSGIALAYVAGAALLAVGLGRLVQKRRQARKGGDE